VTQNAGHIEPTGYMMETQPRRRTPTERAHEMMLSMMDAIKAALTKRTPIHRDSLTTTRNAKGDVQIEVVTYQQDDEPEEAFQARHDTRYDHQAEKHPLSRVQEAGRKYTADELGKTKR